MSTITVHPTTQQTDLERVRNQLQHKLTETEIKLEKAQFQAKQVKKKNQKIQAQLQTSLRKLERTQQKLEMLKTRSSETSGWLRRQWLKLKQRIGDRPSLK
jgi:chromosome segregation ATPase